MTSHQDRCKDCLHISGWNDLGEKLEPQHCSITNVWVLPLNFCDKWVSWDTACPFCGDKESPQHGFCGMYDQGEIPFCNHSTCNNMALYFKGPKNCEYYRPCPFCNGKGYIKNKDVLNLAAEAREICNYIDWDGVYEDIVEGLMNRAHEILIGEESLGEIEIERIFQQTSPKWNRETCPHREIERPMDEEEICCNLLRTYKWEHVIELCSEISDGLCSTLRQTTPICGECQQYISCRLRHNVDEKDVGCRKFDKTNGGES